MVPMEPKAAEPVRNPELTPSRFLLRSLLPLAALALLLLVPLIGPYGFAVAVAGWWFLQRRF